MPTDPSQPPQEYRILTYPNLVALVAQALDLKIATPPRIDFNIAAIDDVSTDDIAQIKYFVSNQHLLTPAFISDLVQRQINTFISAPEIEFSVPLQPKTATTLPQRWQAYLDKLESIVQQVEYRSAKGYELNSVLPPQKQILELLQECWQLTEEWYGVGNANISAYYMYYIRMCDAAHITNYHYQQLGMWQSSDHYVAAMDVPQRNAFIQAYKENCYAPLLRSGGRWALGRTEIDATSISNVFYYKSARQLLYLQIAKQIVMQVMQLENYGQLPAVQRETLWQLIQDHYPVSHTDANSIFYRFEQFCNHMPGACFTDLGFDFPAAANIAPHKLHEIVKVAGLYSKKLILISRSVTENWTPKRYLVLNWTRRYPLMQLRPAGIIESMRLWPNEMPYCSGHGLSLCGDGLMEGLENHDSIAYEWNVPLDQYAEINNAARDIEKMFRELKLLCPRAELRQQLPGEAMISLFQNTLSCSSQHTQHLHILNGTIKEYKLYDLANVAPKYVAALDATLDFVQVGTNADAMFLKIEFTSLDNEALIEFLVTLNRELLKNFGGAAFVDTYIQLFATASGRFVFIFEPHAHLIRQEGGRLLNPENQQSSYPKPLLLQPHVAAIGSFSTDHRLAAGKEYLKQFFDETCKQGAFDFIKSFVATYQSSR